MSPGAPVAVDDLARIDAVLEQLWQANAVAGGSDAPALVRAASFTLLVLAHGRDAADAAAHVLADVTTRHPGRVVIVAAEPEAPASRLEAWLALHCRPIDGGTQVCGEQVVIRAAGEAVERLGGVLPGLLLADCPVIVWWREGPGGPTSLLDALVHDTDAVLIDGARVPVAALPGWVARLAGPDGRIAVTDLAWLRGAAWRRWTADRFEPLELRRALGRLATVRVRYGASAEAVALLYVAWLAARLGWRAAPGLAPAVDGGWEGTLGAAAGPVAVELRPGGPGVGLVDVTLGTGGTDRVGRAVSRAGAEGAVLAVQRGGTPALRPAAREVEPDEVALLGRWLERPRPDPLYGAALAALAAITRPRAG